MNNRGFTIVELLCVIVLIGILALLVTSSINKTVSISDENAYDILKSNIISSAKTYISECENGLIDCKNDYVWENNETSFYASKLIKNSYFKTGDLVNPINDKDLSSCLVINVKRDDNKVLTVTLNDSGC